MSQHLKDTYTCGFDLSVIQVLNLSSARYACPSRARFTTVNRCGLPAIAIGPHLDRLLANTPLPHTQSSPLLNRLEETCIKFGVHTGYTHYDYTKFPATRGAS